MRIAAERGRTARPGLKLGICGEHGGDPASIVFCRGGWARLRLVLALPGAHRADLGGPSCAVWRAGQWNGVNPRSVVASLAVFAAIGTAVGQTRGPVPLPGPTVYSAPTPAPLAPPINPGAAAVPPAGLSPLLTEPGPIYPDSSAVESALSAAAVAWPGRPAEHAVLSQPAA